MKLAKYIANLGYGSRRQAVRMIDEGRVTWRDGNAVAADDPVDHQNLLIDGEPLDPPPGSVLMMHKPVGYECSARGGINLIYDLLPSRFRDRSPVMSPAGRLDLDTSGLLLLTDDGQINHRITSPKTHLPKVYEAHLANDLRGDEPRLFASGELLLESDEQALKPAMLEVIGRRHVRLTLTEGRYHQVRRMFAAVGNHVESLHRPAIGSLDLGDLERGAWRVLTTEEKELLLKSPKTS